MNADRGQRGKGMCMCQVCLIISVWLLLVLCRSKKHGKSIFTSIKKCTKFSFASGSLHLPFSAQCASSPFALPTPAFSSGLTWLSSCLLWEAFPDSPQTLSLVRCPHLMLPQVSVLTVAGHSSYCVTIATQTK